jgi:RHS repeat-associated protein
MQDLNGNTVTAHPGKITDSIGRSFPLFSNMYVIGLVAKCETQQYPVAGGTTAPITICWQQYTATSAVGQTGISEGTANFVAISSVTLQNGTSWKLTYDSWGFLQSVTAPTGAVMTYAYYPPSSTQCDPGVTCGPERILQSRTLNVNGTMSQWTYAYSQVSVPGNGSDKQNIVTDPLGNTVTYLFNETGTEAQTLYKEGPSQTLVKTVQTTYLGGNYPGATNHLPKQTTTTYPNGQSTTTCVIYDNNTNTTCTGTDAPVSGGLKVYDPNDALRGIPGFIPYSAPLVLGSPMYSYVYDYTTGSGTGTLLSKTTNTYQWQANDSYRAANLLNLVSTSSVSGSGTDSSSATHTYDAPAYGPSGVHGNATTEVDGGSVTTHAYYNASGMTTGVEDGNSHTSTIAYDATGAYPETVTLPETGGVNHIESFVYDANIGRMISHTDGNKQKTTYGYDAMRRPISVTYPDTGEETYTYNDTTPSPTVTYKKTMNAGTTYTEVATEDALGRQTQTELTSDPEGPVYTNTTYDGLGNVHSVSNPHRSTAEASDGTTSYAYDVLGRKTLQTQQDGSSMQKWLYTGNMTTFTDEAGHAWQRTSDALGRLTQVAEPTGASTVYTYDALGNLLTVNQKGISGETARNRSFTYDSLSRLLTSTNPETGAISYGYDTNSNMTSKTDARGIKTSYTYDTLNRLTQKTYNDGVTNTSLYGYDSSSINFVPVPQNGRGNVSVSLANTIGRLTFASSTTSGSLDAFSYDSMGRLVNQWSSAPSFNIDNGTIAAISAGYDLAGNMTSLTYPDGRTVNQQWNGGGHLTQVSDVSGQYQYLTPSTTYWPNGTPSAVFYGNGVGNGTYLNNRLQTDEIGIVRVGSAAPGSYPGNNNLAVKEYCYGPATSAISPELPGCPSRGSANNGNIWQVMDVLHSGYTENLSYDSLNRLGSFSRVDGSLSQTYAYDSFGNLNQTSPGTLQNAVSYGANNRINTASYGYDNAGNLTASFNGISTAFNYDAENRLTGVNNGAATYTYDGNGDRVRKDNGSNWTEYVRFGGQVVAEKTSDGFWSDYIYANGKRIAKVDNNDIRIHMSGTNCSGCGIINTFAGTSSLAAFVNGTVIQNGDLLTWRQFQDGVAAGGISVAFNNNTVGTSGVLRAADGQLADADTRTGTGLWYQRVANLSSYAGDTVSALTLYNYQGGAAGHWDIYLADISLVHPDGTSVPIYYRSLEQLPQFTPGGAESNVAVVTEKVAATPNPYDVTYYSTNQIGSSILLTDSAGWPVSSDTYYPFGQEPTPSADGNHYKFTGKERDTESGLDYFGARYYGSSIGRFMSPDDGRDQDPSDPQSWNLYSYVRNNPLVHIDPDGHSPCGDTEASGALHGVGSGLDTGSDSNGDQVAPECATAPEGGAADTTTVHANGTVSETASVSVSATNSSDNLNLYQSGNGYSGTSSIQSQAPNKGTCTPVFCPANDTPAPTPPDPKKAACTAEAQAAQNKFAKNPKAFIALNGSSRILSTLQNSRLPGGSPLTWLKGLGGLEALYMTWAGNNALNQAFYDATFRACMAR